MDNVNQTTTPHTLEYILNNAWLLIKELNGPNLVIGGSQALLIHGLELGRRSHDLDIIIYEPTDEQMKALRTLDIFSDRTAKSDMDYDVDKDSPRRSFKFRINRLEIDILLERNKPTPTSLLLYSHRIGNIACMLFPIQSIQNIINAKRNYRMRHDEGLQLYSRSKDMIDFQNLKNLNFNFIQ